MSTSSPAWPQPISPPGPSFGMHRWRAVIQISSTLTPKFSSRLRIVNVADSEPFSLKVCDVACAYCCSRVRASAVANLTVCPVFFSVCHSPS